jgi:predicted Zn-dependent protease
MQIPKDARVLPPSDPRTRSVQFIIESLAKNIETLEGLPPHLKDIEWNVTVVEHRMVNAMAAPGGQVLVFTGKRP